MHANSRQDALVIRSYRADDASSLTALFQASIRNIARADYTDAQIRAWAPNVIDPGPFGEHCAEKSTWVAESNGLIAGFSDLEPDGHIDMLYVHPDCQRRGVARALLAHIEKLAREQALVRLYTEASITARLVFERSGFEVIAEQTVTIRGASMNNFRMEKWLNGRRPRQ
jgi:putative acetyltransferase